MGEHDVDRVAAIARGGMQADDDGEFEELRLDTFVIVASYVGVDGDGDEVETTAVWSESRKHHVKVGLLHLGLDRLSDHLGP